MLKRSEINELADAGTAVYGELEALIMQNIIRHVSDYGQLIDSDTWLLQKLAEIGALTKENIAIIKKCAGLSQTAVERMLEETTELVLDRVEHGLTALEKQGIVNGAISPKQSENVKTAVNAIYDQAKDSLNLCNTTMLYKAKDIFSQVVNETVRQAKEIENKQDFLNVLNRHATAEVIGAEARQQAIRNVIQEFNEKGIPAFVDKRGREWTPEAYVSMTLRTTASHTVSEVMMARMDDRELNLLQVSSHSGARPKCAKDQGKIFDRNNQSGVTTDLHDKEIPFYPWNESSYGQPDGLLGINCGHHITPFIPGISTKRYFPTEDYEENDKLYKQMQTQRSIERAIRKQKRLCSLYDVAGDSESFEKAAVKLKQTEDKIKDYVSKNKQLVRRKDREWVAGFDKGVSARAVGAKKRVLSAVKTVDKKAGNDIIKIEAKPGTAKYRKLKREKIIERCIAEKRPVFAEDDFGKFAKNIHKKQGFYDVAMHGAPKFVKVFDERTDAKTIAKILKNRSDYHDTPVRLLSCYTGKGEDCFAQRLANELGVVVEAPNDIIWARADRTYTIGPNKYKNTGKMILFYPQKGEIS